MRVVSYREPKSSFLSIEKDLGIITDAFLKNNVLKKLLYYTSSDALNRPALTEEESYSLIGKNIKIVPKIFIDPEVLNYIIIGLDNFTPNLNNPEFRDNLISFDIICHWDQWDLRDYKLRPYRIAAEIDTMFNKKHLTGIGQLEFVGMRQIVLSNEYSGVSLLYAAIHGGEDQKNMPNPADEEQFQILMNYTIMMKSHGH